MFVTDKLFFIAKYTKYFFQVYINVLIYISI